MLIALIGDTHLGHSKSSDIVHDYFKKSYDYYFTEFERLGISHIIQTGDLFDYRREVHFNTLYRSREYFLDRLGGYTVTIISGNHDSLFKNTNKINSVRLLMNSPNITVVDDVPITQVFDGVAFDFYPWINNENLDACLTYAANTDSECAVGHFEFVNFPLHPGSNAESGMDHKLFKKYAKVYSGHYHTQSVSDNVQYTGTPYELTWVDCNDPKGVWIYDTETKEATFLPNPYSLFEKIEYVEGMDYDFSNVKDKYVKVVVVHRESQKKFEDFLYNVSINGPHDTKVIESSVVAAVSEAVAKKVDMVSTSSIIDGVLDTIETPLDIPTLKNKMNSKYSEAMNILSQL